MNDSMESVREKFVPPEGMVPPKGLSAAMEGLAKEVLLKTPNDIYNFAAEFFEKLTLIRNQTTIMRGKTLDISDLLEMDLKDFDKEITECAIKNHKNLGVFEPNAEQEVVASKKSPPSPEKEEIIKNESVKDVPESPVEEKSVARNITPDKVVDDHIDNEDDSMVDEVFLENTPSDKIKKVEEFKNQEEKVELKIEKEIHERIENPIEKIDDIVESDKPESGIEESDKTTNEIEERNKPENEIKESEYGETKESNVGVPESKPEDDHLISAEEAANESKELVKTVVDDTKEVLNSVIHDTKDFLEKEASSIIAESERLLETVGPQNESDQTERDSPKNIVSLESLRGVLENTSNSLKESLMDDITKSDDSDLQDKASIDELVSLENIKNSQMIQVFHTTIDHDNILSSDESKNSDKTLDPDNATDNENCEQLPDDRIEKSMVIEASNEPETIKEMVQARFQPEIEEIGQIKEEFTQTVVEVKENIEGLLATGEKEQIAEIPISEVDLAKTEDEGSSKSEEEKNGIFVKATILIQRVFRGFLVRSKLQRKKSAETVRISDVNDEESQNNQVPVISKTDPPESKVTDESILSSGDPIVEISPKGLLEPALYTVPEEKNTSYSTEEESSTFSSAATKIQAGVRGFLTRKYFQQNKTNNSSDTTAPSIGEDSRSLDDAGNIIDGHNAEDTVNKIIVATSSIIIEQLEHFEKLEQRSARNSVANIDSADLKDGVDESSRASHIRKRLRREDAIQHQSPFSSDETPVPKQASKNSDDEEPIGDLAESIISEIVTNMYTPIVQITPNMKSYMTDILKDDKDNGKSKTKKGRDLKGKNDNFNLSIDDSNSESYNKKSEGEELLSVLSDDSSDVVIASPRKNKTVNQEIITKDEAKETTTENVNNEAEIEPGKDVDNLKEMLKGVEDKFATISSENPTSDETDIQSEMEPEKDVVDLKEMSQGVEDKFAKMSSGNRASHELNIRSEMELEKGVDDLKEMSQGVEDKLAKMSSGNRTSYELATTMTMDRIESAKINRLLHSSECHDALLPMTNVRKAPSPKKVMMEPAKTTDASPEELSASATTIQAGIRGYLVRKHQKLAKEAATKIQAGFRGFKARKEIKNSHQTS